MGIAITEKQRTELNQSVAAYLKANFPKTYEAFVQESEVQTENVDAATQLLERKFLTNARLQVKINTLEKQIAAMQNETGVEAPTRDKRKRDEWIPRPPELATLTGHRSIINCAIFHPIYSLIVTGSDDASIRVWDATSARCERVLQGHSNAVNDLAFNKKGTKLMSCSSDMTARIWDFTKTFSSLKTLAGHDHSISSVALAGENFALTASRDTLIKLWDLENMHCIHNFRGHVDWVRMIRLDPAEQFLASCSSARDVKIWNMETKEMMVELYGHDHIVECLTWASDETVKALKITNDTDSERTLYISGKPLVLASSGRDKVIRIWHLNFGMCLYAIDGHDNWVTGLAFHPAGKYLVSSSDDKTMKTWDLLTQQMTKSISAHNQFVRCIDFHKREPYVVTGSADGTAKIWECR